MRSLKEYLNSLRGSHTINMILCIKNDAMRTYLHSKLSQLELYLSVIVIQDLDCTDLQSNYMKPGSVSVLISDEAKDEPLLKLCEHLRGLGIIQISLNGEGGSEKIRGSCMVRLRVPIRISVFYRTIQEVLLLVIYSQAVSIVSPIGTSSIGTSAFNLTMSTPMPQYTPVEQPECIAERFPMSILVVDDDNISKMVHRYDNTSM